VALPRGQYESLTSSSQDALAWASAAAVSRGFEGAARAPIEPPDLFVGVLLAHPGEDGEARRLLLHFGLTARDVMPATYPVLSQERLATVARRIVRGTEPPIEPESAQIIERAVSLRDSRNVHVRYLLAALLDTTNQVAQGFTRSVALIGVDPRGVMRSILAWLERPDVRDLQMYEAGRSLGDMLMEEHPLRPVNVPTYSADRAEVADDLVGIRGEIDAFAYLLASRALVPPLAVGLFGDWGSGKSFFMSAVEQRVASIAEQVDAANQHESPFWHNVRQIRFNAWEYIQGTLWASLIDHIFTKLENPEYTPLLKRRHKELSDAIEQREKDAEAASEREGTLRQEVETCEQQVAEAESARDAALETAAAERDKELMQRSSKLLLDVLGDAAAPIVGKNLQDLGAALVQGRSELERAHGLLGAYWTPRRTRMLLLAGVVAVVLITFLTILDVAPVITITAALAALAPTVTTVLRSATEWSRAQLDELEAIRGEVDAALAEQLRKPNEALDKARAALESADAKLAQQEAQKRAVEHEAAELRSEQEQLTAGDVLTDYLAAQSRSEYYRRRLGLLAKVREDLYDLEGSVRDSNREALNPDTAGQQAEARGRKPPPNRIILYIDDLDRCPADKVVEVLEAVHLLLAFELFVVVVAVDSRWLSFSLADELRALQPSSGNGARPTTTDYLEKIFQVPFWVDPLSPEGRGSLVHGLLEGTVRPGDDAPAEPPGHGQALKLGADQTKVIAQVLTPRGARLRLEADELSLRPDDLRFVESLAPILGDTPRRVKRFVNVLLLLLAMPRPDPPSNELPSDRAVISFVAALNSGQPWLARRLFEEADRAQPVPLGEIVKVIAADAEVEAARLTQWLAQRPEWREVSLSRLRPTLALARRLTFEPPVRPRATAPSVR
jgi:hypothetical protein